MPWPKGRPRAEETKQKIAAAQEGHLPWNTGTPMAEATRQKISEASRGKPRTWRLKPLRPEEVTEDIRPFFAFDRQFVPEAGKGLRIWRTCSICGEAFHSSVQDIRSGLKRHGKRITSYCFRCAHQKGAHQRGLRAVSQGVGAYQHVHGYILVYRPDHPRASNGYVPQHRLVMEEILGRLLEPHEKVHHRNGVRHDNRPENLELWTLRHDQPAGARVMDWVIDQLFQQPEMQAMPKKYRTMIRDAIARLTQQSFFDEGT